MKHSESTHAHREVDFERRRKLMVALWARGSQFFGGLWEATYGSVGEQTIYAWQGATSTLTELQLATGVRGLEKWQDKYPPTFGQFRALCTAQDQVRSNAIGVGHQLTHQVDRQAVKHIAEQELAKMRALAGLE